MTIGECLKINTVLATLILKSDVIWESLIINLKKAVWTDSGIGDEGAANISESLKKNNSLTELDLTCCENKVL